MATNFAQVWWSRAHAQVRPRVGKVSWHFTVGPNVFLRLFASLQVVCERYSAKLNGHKLRAGFVGPTYAQVRA